MVRHRKNDDFRKRRPKPKPRREVNPPRARVFRKAMKVHNRTKNGGFGPVQKVFSSPKKKFNNKTHRPSAQIVKELTGMGAYRYGNQRFSSKTHKLKEKQEGGKPWYEELANTVGPLLGKLGMEAIKGFGDYEVDTNSMMAEATNGKQGDQIPMMKNTKVSNVIQKREFIGNVMGSTLNFFPQTYYINPGLDESFPWLYPIANSFTAYRILGMIYEYKSLATNYSTNIYMGYVAMGTQYNVSDPTFTDKESLENSEYANSCKPSEDLIHPIECAPQQIVLTEQYIRAGAVPTGNDPRFYDLGKMTIATGGQATAGILGELWATYEIEFYQPVLNIAKGTLVNADHWNNTAVTGANPMGANRVQQAGGTLPSEMSNTSYLFPASVTGGTHMVEFFWSGTNVAVATYPAISYTNFTLKTFTAVSDGTTITKSGAFSIPPNGATTMPRMGLRIVGDISNGSQAMITFDTAGLFPGGTNVLDVFCVQIPTSLSLTEEEQFLQKMRKTRGFMDTPEYHKWTKEQEPPTELEVTLGKYLQPKGKKHVYNPTPRDEDEDEDEKMDREVNSICARTDIPLKVVERLYIKNGFDFKKTLTYIYENLMSDSEEDTFEEDANLFFDRAISLEKPEEKDGRQPNRHDPYPKVRSTDNGNYTLSGLGAAALCSKNVNGQTVTFSDGTIKSFKDQGEEEKFYLNEYNSLSVVNRLTYLNSCTFISMERKSQAYQTLVADMQREAQKYKDQLLKASLAKESMSNTPSL